MNVCCFCKLPTPEHQGAQVHVCSESFICFECLIQERWENDHVEAYKSDFATWWMNTELRCPICNLVVKFDDHALHQNAAFNEVWRVTERPTRIQKHGQLLAKYTVLRGRSEVMETSVNMERTRNNRLKNRNKSLQTQIDKLKERIIEQQTCTFQETQKLSDCTARYLNVQSKIIRAINYDLTIYESSKRKLIEVFGDDIENYADYLMGKKPKSDEINPNDITVDENGSPPYSFTYPVVFTPSGNISELFSEENAQLL